MKKQINGIINMVNRDNVPFCAKALFRLNLIRARAILVKIMMRAQLASPDLSPVFACLISVIGSRLPQVTELLVARLIAQLKAAYAHQDRVLCFATARFIAHLFNQQVVTDLLLLEFLTTCMVDPSDGSIELAVVTLRDCAVLLSEKSPRALEHVFQRLREVLHDGDLSRRVQVMIEDLIVMRREKFANANVLDPRLDLLEEEDIITHLASLADEDLPELHYEYNAFQYDANYDENERQYETIKRDILGAEADPPVNGPPAVVDTGDKSVSKSQGDAVVPVATKHDWKTTSEFVEKGRLKVTDMTETELVDFRRSVYLTIGSGLSYEEWAHKLVNLMRKHPGRELELCEMIVESCSQEKTYLRSYGLLGQRFCLLNRVYVGKYEELFATHYATIHKFDTRKIRNMANLYASLFAADSLPWGTFQLVRIVQKETTTSSRIFLKYLFQEISSTLGHSRTKERFAKASAQGFMDGVLPTSNFDDAKFAINFFTNIGLGFVTQPLRDMLKTIPKITTGDAAGGPSGADDDIASSQESSSLSSSSLSSSSLSESSGIENTASGRHRLASGSKRTADDSSLEESERPAKTRRGSSRRAGSEDGGAGSLDRCVIPGTWRGYERSGYDHADGRHRGGRSSFRSMSPSIREGKRFDDGGRLRLSRREDRREESRSARRRSERARFRHAGRQYDDSDVESADYDGDRRRQRFQRREGYRSDRKRRGTRGERSRSGKRRDGSVSGSGEDRSGFGRREFSGEESGGRYGGGRRSGSSGRRFERRSAGRRRREFDDRSSDDRLELRSRSASPERRFDGSDFEDDGYGRRRGRSGSVSVPRH